MDGSSFDAFTRQFAHRHRLSRRRFLGLLGVGAAALPLRFGVRSAGAVSGASSVVTQFYELVDAYQYQSAYALLGSGWQARQSQSNFTGGYTNTAFVRCTTTGETQSGGNTLVGVKLVSWHNDGTIVAYTGSYTVGTEGGEQRILSGNIKTASVPSGTPPLCKIADLAFGFGSWQGAAGSRIGSVSAKNVSGRACLVGGSPRVTLNGTDGQTLVSSSEAGSPPIGVVLDAGQRAAAPLRFANWCGASGNPASVRVEVPGDVNHIGRVSYAAHGISFPPCNGPSQPALLEIKGFTA